MRHSRILPCIPTTPVTPLGTKGALPTGRYFRITIAHRRAAGHCCAAELRPGPLSAGACVTADALCSNLLQMHEPPLKDWLKFKPRGAGCEARGGRGLGAVAMSDLKIEVARRQLGMATELYLRDLDPVSVHSLANAGCELIEFYARKLSGKALLSDFAQLAHNTDIAKLKRLQREYWTAFKHATTQRKPKKPAKERDDEDLLKQFTDEKNDLALVIGWSDYYRATGKMPIEAQAQQLWFFALHPEKHGNPELSRLSAIAFPDLQSKSRADQKGLMNGWIKRARADTATMSHPMTEQRPLVTDWPLG
jgi:hypothetical protein